MTSWRGKIIEYAIAAKFKEDHDRTHEQNLDRVRDIWPEEAKSEVLPSFITSSSSNLTVERESFQGPTQKWETFHVKETVGKGKAGADKVMVYWHGGAFYKAASPYHWAAVQKTVTDFSTPSILPRYTLLPLSTSHEFVLNALPFLFSVLDDPRYTGKQIVMMGDSAGGWMVLRLIQELIGIVLGERDGGMADGEGGKKEEMREKAGRLLDRMPAGIMISPCLNFELTDETIEAAKKDYWLSTTLSTSMLHMWAYGPSAFPSHSFNLPSDYTPLPGPHHPITHPSYSVNFGIDLFKRYRERFPEKKVMRLVQFVSTGDMLCPTNVRMGKELKGLGEEAVRSEIHVEEGLYHVYPLVWNLGGIPEYRRAWATIEDVLTS